MMERIAASPRLKAKIAGIFYLLPFLTGGVALFVAAGWVSQPASSRARAISL